MAQPWGFESPSSHINKGLEINVLVRLSLLFSLILACSGCFQMSKASRDSDEDEWGAKWGTDGSKGDQAEKEEPPKPTISEKDRKDSFIPLPPPSPMEGKQPAKPVKPATPKTMKPPPPPPE